MTRYLKYLTAAFLAIMLGVATAAEDPTRVAFVYVGPVSDHGWTYQHDQGRLALEAALGDDVITTFVENVSEGPDAERVIRQLAATGQDVIFTTSFGFMNPTVKVAEQFPDVTFGHATGYKRTDNLTTYSSRFYEGRYVLGQIAARMSETGIVGYVASFPIPEVVRGINSFMLGMQSINPDAQIKVVWVSSWFDPGKEGDAAKAMIDQGADVITQHTDSPAPLRVAEERGVYAFGQASDMIAFAPNAQLTAIIDDWSGFYVSQVEAVRDGTWESTDIWGGFNTGMVAMAPFTNMPDDVAAMAQATVDKISSGELHPFQGPLYNQEGELVVAEGEVLDDGTLAGLNWYVKGIEDTLPSSN